MERYEAYKDSGIEWIGEIPEGWQIRSFKGIGRVASNLQHPQDHPSLVQVSPDRIEKGTGRLLPCVTVEEAGVESDNHLFATGDILYSKVRPALNKVTVATFDGMCSADMYPIKTFENARWLMYYMLSSAFMEQVVVSTDRVKMPKINKEELGVFKVVVPSQAEQQAIADFLDAETARIDGLVADCEREVGLLREYRKAVVSEAVTKGLDPDAPMKDSGVEWIGEIPEGWEAEKAKLHLIFINGRAYKQEELLDDGKYRVLRVGNFNTNDKWYYSNFELDKKQYCDKGDLLYLWATTFGPQIWQGERVIFHYHIWKILCQPSINKQFAYYALAAQASWQELQSHGSTMVHVTKRGMEQSELPIPPLAEQREIVDFLDAKTAEIDGLVEAKRQMAEKLREYRKSLVSEAVTGKFKAPGVA